jgi:hypothetical protein
MVRTLQFQISNINIGRFYYELARRQPTVDIKRKHFLVSKSHIEEGFRIGTKIHCPNHPNTVQAASILPILMNELSRL